MAKHRMKRQVVYHNNNTDNWTSDAKEQLSLVPGSDGYNARQERLFENSPMSEQNLKNVVKEQYELQKIYEEDHDTKDLAEDFVDAFEKGGQSASVLRYRSKMQREDAVCQTAEIASDGLGRNISPQEIEARNDSITVKDTDVPGALKSYKAELSQREVPTMDLDGDGDIDKDDVIYTPGMKHMRNYM